jgi:hypothetical protein
MFGNNFSQGYQQGQTDQAQGASKRVVYRPVARLLKPDVFLPNFSARFAEYWRGYNTGFEDRERTLNTQTRQTPNTTTHSAEQPMRKSPEQEFEILPENPKPDQSSGAAQQVKQQTQQGVNNILNASSTGASSVSNPSIDQQIRILLTLQSKLNQLQDNLIDVGNSYQQAVQQTQSEGVLSDYHQLLEQAMSVVHANIRTLYQGVEQEDKVLLKKMIQRLESLKDVG